MFEALICVVLFEPSEDDISFWKKRCEEWIGYKFYIHDNSVSNNKIKFVSPNTVYFNDGNNSGLSAAYNKALRYAELMDFMVTFDQDSRPCRDYISIGLKAFAANPQIGVVGSFAGLPKRKLATKSMLVNFLISSGSCYKVKDLNQIGGFDPYYFIDRVDLDVCKSLTLFQNKKILALEDLKMRHAIGEQKQKLFIKYREHSSIRNYYMARNRVYYYKKYYLKYGVILYVLLGLTKQIFFILIFNSQPVKKFWATINGTIDGFKGI